MNWMCRTCGLTAKTKSTKPTCTPRCWSCNESMGLEKDVKPAFDAEAAQRRAEQDAAMGFGPDGARLPDEPKPDEAPKDVGCPAVIGDRLAPVFDFAAGRSFDSRAERKRFYKANQMRRVSAGEFARHHDDSGGHAAPNRGISYPGQTDRRSGDERGPKIE